MKILDIRIKAISPAQVDVTSTELPYSNRQVIYVEVLALVMLDNKTSFDVIMRLDPNNDISVDAIRNVLTSIEK